MEKTVILILILIILISAWISSVKMKEKFNMKFTFKLKNKLFFGWFFWWNNVWQAVSYPIEMLNYCYFYDDSAKEYSYIQKIVLGGSASKSTPSQCFKIHRRAV